MDEYREEYCKDAERILLRHLICGKDCPLAGDKCPRMILEASIDQGIEQAIDAMIKAVEKR